MSRTTKKPYPNKFDSRRFDWSCKNHGSCSHCRHNRLFADKKARVRANMSEQEQDQYPCEEEDWDSEIDSW